jgi:hypothetical protein
MSSGIATTVHGVSALFATAIGAWVSIGTRVAVRARIRARVGAWIALGAWISAWVISAWILVLCLSCAETGKRDEREG